MPVLQDYVSQQLEWRIVVNKVSFRFCTGVLSLGVHA